MPRISAEEEALREAGLIKQPKQKITIPDALESDDERALYRKILESSFSTHLFSQAAESLLIQYVRHSLASDAISKAIKSQAAQDDLKLLLSLLKSQKDETSSLSSLAQKLKIAPSSISTWSGNKLTPRTRKPKPWEFGN